MKAVYGPITLEQSADRIVAAAAAVPADQPLIVMAHCGPSGLGSEANSPCGRDWKPPAVDWGDQDLALALDRMAHRRRPDLVVFGHMHHQLKRSKALRRSLLRDRHGTAFLNAACVPRSGRDAGGRELLHVSWRNSRVRRSPISVTAGTLPDAQLLHVEELPVQEALAC